MLALLVLEFRQVCLPGAAATAQRAQWLKTVWNAPRLRRSIVPFSTNLCTVFKEHSVALLAENPLILNHTERIGAGIHSRPTASVQLSPSR